MDDVASKAVEVLASALVGFVSALATFRTRFAVMDARHIAFADRMAVERLHDKELLKIMLDEIKSTNVRIERRQLATMEIVVNIAKKAGTLNREVGNDFLAELLTTHDDTKKD